MARRLRPRESPEKALTIVLRRCYSEGFVRLRQLRDGHRRLQAWSLARLQSAARESQYAGDFRFEYRSEADGEMLVALSPHLRLNRHGQ